MIIRHWILFWSLSNSLNKWAPNSHIIIFAIYCTLCYQLNPSKSATRLLHLLNQSRYLNVVLMTRVWKLVVYNCMGRNWGIDKHSIGLTVECRVLNNTQKAKVRLCNCLQRESCGMSLHSVSWTQVCYQTQVYHIFILFLQLIDL